MKFESRCRLVQRTCNFSVLNLAAKPPRKPKATRFYSRTQSGTLSLPDTDTQLQSSQQSPGGVTSSRSATPQNTRKSNSAFHAVSLIVNTSLRAQLFSPSKNEQVELPNNPVNSKGAHYSASSASSKSAKATPSKSKQYRLSHSLSKPPQKSSIETRAESRPRSDDSFEGTLSGDVGDPCDIPRLSNLEASQPRSGAKLAYKDVPLQPRSSPISKMAAESRSFSHICNFDFAEIYDALDEPVIDNTPISQNWLSAPDMEIPTASPSRVCVDRGGVGEGLGGEPGREASNSSEPVHDRLFSEYSFFENESAMFGDASRQKESQEQSAPIPGENFYREVYFSRQRQQDVEKLLSALPPGKQGTVCKPLSVPRCFPHMAFRTHLT